MVTQRLSGVEEKVNFSQLAATAANAGCRTFMHFSRKLDDGFTGARGRVAAPVLV
jgi:hypothetical protein